MRGRRVATRGGGGGLVGVIRPVVERLGGTWIAAALTPEDHEVAAEKAEIADNGFSIRLVSLPPEAHHGHYDVVSNEHLWFVFHYLYDLAEAPAFDASFKRAWDGYREVNRLYAHAVLEAGLPEVVFVEDYHLMTMAREIRSARPGWDAPLCYFHHAPWAEPDYFSMLPAGVVQEILRGMLAHDVIGFHCSRWARSFLACCERLLPGCSVSDDAVRHEGRTVRVLVAPAQVNSTEIQRRAAQAPTDEKVAQLVAERGGRRTLLRVERIDLSKNVLRGLLAFETLLERRPDLVDDVWFLALGYPSRPRVIRYRRYLDVCRATARRINDRFGQEGGTRLPLHFDVRDDFSRSLAGMRMADVLLVNPVFDGLNMVAKEAMLVNERDAVLVLSHNAGVYEELGRDAVGVNPFDVGETTTALERALEMPDAERRRRASRLRRTVRAGTPEGWARGRLDAAGIHV